MKRSNLSELNFREIEPALLGCETYVKWLKRVSKVGFFVS